eukprot:SAG31_NODE_1926_length_6892_cov_3.588105_1_plen_179_part_00
MYRYSSVPYGYRVPGMLVWMYGTLYAMYGGPERPGQCGHTGQAGRPQQARLFGAGIAPDLSLATRLKRSPFGRRWWWVAPHHEQHRPAARRVIGEHSSGRAAARVAARDGGAPCRRRRDVGVLRRAASAWRRAAGCRCASGRCCCGRDDQLPRPLRVAHASVVRCPPRTAIWGVPTPL